MSKKFGEYEIANGNQIRNNFSIAKYGLENCLKFHLLERVEDLSNGACTPDGILKKTAGMDAEDIKNAKLGDFEDHIKNYFKNRR